MDLSTVPLPTSKLPPRWSGAFRPEKPPTSGPGRRAPVREACARALLSCTNSCGPRCGAQASRAWGEGGSSGSRLLLWAALPAVPPARPLQPALAQNS